MIKDIAPYATILAAIIAAYLTYRNQLRLKTFELLTERRNLVLKDIETFIEDLYTIKADSNEEPLAESSKKYLREYFHRGLILMHKIKGANFGPNVDILTDTFFSLVANPGTNGEITREQFKDWITRTTNVASVIYGFAHRELTIELEKMAFSWITRKLKAHTKKNSVKPKQNR